MSHHNASRATSTQRYTSHLYVGGNRLIDELAPEERLAIAALLRVVPLHLDDPIFRVQEDFDRIVFPIDSVISVVNLFEDGAVAEVATIGCDGFCPLEALAESKHVLRSSVCRATGEAAIMRRADFDRALDAYPGFASMIRRYMTLRLLKAETIIACNATHSLMQRTARWLLTMRHHIGRAQFPMTQETLALLLGVRRAGVNEAITYLKNIGAIRWRRSYVEISEEAKLIAAACECYRAIRVAFSDVA